MTDLDLDIETRSSVDLLKHGVYAYSASPDFEILMCAWSYNDSPIEIAIGRDEILDIPGLLDPGVTKWAHNAQFERVCFSRFIGMPEGQFLPVEQWEDTQAIGAEAGLPQSLSKMAAALGAEPKDGAGTRLINLFSKPVRGKWVQPADKPEQWSEFIEYCIQDVAVMQDIKRKLPPWPPGERQVYEVDQRINDRGVLLDLDLARRAVQVDAVNQTGYRTELCNLLGIENAGSVQQIVKGLEKIGLRLPNLQQETIETTLTRKLTEPQRRALVLRQETALVASKKYEAALGAAGTDSRFRGGFKFCGAHTKRWSSKGVQIQNIPSIKIEHQEAAALDLMLGFDTDAQTLKALVRSMFVGPFTVVDYKSIEARILAWWAREMWAVDAFREGRDIYTETAKRMGESMTRQDGKIATLALGYAGSVGSLRGMGYGEGMTDEKVKELVYAWRRANPKIVKLWGTVEETFMSGGQVGVVKFEKDGKDRIVTLPSGSPLIYHNVGLAEGKHGPRIMFDGHRGFRTDTYSGRLVENICQSMSRDVLALALVNLEREGYQTVIHCHDEVVVEGLHPVEEIAAIMCSVPWAKGLPLDAEGGQSEWYRKP